MTPAIESVFEADRAPATGWRPDEVRRLAVPGGHLYEWNRTCLHSGETSRQVVFVPGAPYGADAPHHVCDHGFAAWTCGFCLQGRG